MRNYHHNVEVNSKVEKMIALIGLSPLFMGAFLQAQIIVDPAAIPETTIFTPKTPPANPPAKPVVADEETPSGASVADANEGMESLNALIISKDVQPLSTEQKLTGLHLRGVS